MIYLDNAASTPLCPEALEAMKASLEGQFANPSSVHKAGREARKVIEHARKSVANLLHADSSAIIFTSGATESDNLAVRGVLEPVLRAGRSVHVVTTSLEHPAVAETLEDLKVRGLEITVISPGANGVVSADDVLRAVRPETVLVSVIMVSNEMGAIQPIDEIGKGLRKLGDGRPVFHTDAVQGLVTQEIDLAKLPVDLLTASGHKIYGPKGVGVLYVRRGLDKDGFHPVQTGGGHERCLRSGTENLAGIVGIGAAAIRLSEKKGDDLTHYEMARARVVSAITEKKLRAKPLLDESVSVAPNILSLECSGAVAEELVMRLSVAGIMVAAGSACKSGDRGASPILLSMGLSKERAKSVIRVSFGIMNTKKDVDAFIDALQDALKFAK